MIQVSFTVSLSIIILCRLTRAHTHICIFTIYIYIYLFIHMICLSSKLSFIDGYLVHYIVLCDCMSNDD